MTDDREFPYRRPAGSDLDMFIQWKGTELCADFHCDCGYHGHIDADFAYHVRCDGCGQVYEMGCQVVARKVDIDAEESRVVTFYDRMPKDGNFE